MKDLPSLNGLTLPAPSDTEPRGQVGGRVKDLPSLNGLTLPAPSDTEPRGQVGSRVERPIVDHLVHLGLDRDGPAVHRESQLRVLHAQRVVVPLVVTHLSGRAGSVRGQRSAPGQRAVQLVQTDAANGRRTSSGKDVELGQHKRGIICKCLYKNGEDGARIQTCLNLNIIIIVIMLKCVLICSISLGKIPWTNRYRE